MNILIAGSSGLIGKALMDSFSQSGDTVFPLVRAPGLSDAPYRWWPADNQMQWDQSVPIDVVINLCGDNIANARWSKKKKRAILESRIQSTSFLVQAMSELSVKPRIFLSASAIGFYGSSKGHWKDETCQEGEDFLAEVAKKWEAVANQAASLGIRTVNMRFGMVLSPLGGALSQMLLPFQFGLGGVIGDGRQYFSWVSLAEVVRMVRYIIQTESISGPVNLVSPEPVQNRVFVKSLAGVLNRPALLPLPEWVARIAFGEMADHLLLSSIRAYPKMLKESGYVFQDKDLIQSLHGLLRKKQN